MSTLRGPHRRYNPLLDEWVLCSPQRLDRPWQGQIEPASEEARPRYDPGCYLCPGNARARGVRNPEYASTFAFDNDFPALRPETDEAGLNGDPSAPIPPVRLGNTPEGLSLRGGETVEMVMAGRDEDDDALLLSRREAGICRVLCFSPRHDLTLAEMDERDIRRVVDAWDEEVQTLERRDWVRHVQVFENKGAAMGSSNPHPHGQIWATSSLPTRPRKMLDATRRYHRAHGTDLLGDYLGRELTLGERLVCANEHWVALVPFWAVWPFEVMLLPRRRAADLRGLDTDDRDALAEILKRVLVRYDNLFQCSFPYTMGWQGRPSDGEPHDYWRLHAAFFPPLLRSATVRKFLVGYELTAEAQRDLSPEEAALRLRESSEQPDSGRAA